MENTTQPSKESIEYYKAQNEKLEMENEALEAKLKWYEEQFRLSQQRQFGSSSEKSNPDQLSLFNEAEETADSTVEEPTVETITYTRKKQRGERDQKLENLPAETIEYRLSDEEQVCSCCGGALHDMSTEVRKELKVIPAQVKVVEHVRHVYSCRHCERHGIETPIMTAKMPEPVFPGSLASPSAMAYTMTQKYVEGMPLYRQEKHLERFGVSIPRQTLANWVLYGANTWLKHIYDEMYAHLIKHDILHADETTLQVLSEPDRPAKSTSYIWLYRTGRESFPIVLYDYQQTRASKHPQRFLADFQGYLHVDGYAGYNSISNVVPVGCWAHARRNFTEALRALPESASTTAVKAKEGLAFCNKLFDMERELKDASPQERYEKRLERSQPVLEAFLAWLKEQTPRVLPKSALGKAIKYCRNQWERLEAFLKDGRLEIDNNRAERSIKPFIIGRKNWLFSNTTKGAKSSAIIYSVVETAKENGLNPFNYLSYLFEELPNMDTTDKEQLAQYLPWSATLPQECHVPNKSK
ncbi:IS66 family transposase [Lentibacillus cibarius]|uniref:IS66 family transposase n=2 Tax=Lentibacillus cibarius TaxID=2583219 RepID=A0A549YMW8_9BACI|nr:IS66 family transposase [Lentibacillus cibarius]TRM13165.1 IS66 family transposase [Lentibacillus cibarius]TRM13231.1 IS66 family transposase [Lentibacillus cibarius]